MDREIDVSRDFFFTSKSAERRSRDPEIRLARREQAAVLTPPRHSRYLTSVRFLLSPAGTYVGDVGHWQEETCSHYITRKNSCFTKAGKG